MRMTPDTESESYLVSRCFETDFVRSHLRHTFALFLFDTFARLHIGASGVTSSIINQFENRFDQVFDCVVWVHYCESILLCLSLSLWPFASHRNLTRSRNGKPWILPSRFRQHAQTVPLRLYLTLLYPLIPLSLSLSLVCLRVKWAHHRAECIPFWKTLIASIIWSIAFSIRCRRGERYRESWCSRYWCGNINSVIC